MDISNYIVADRAESADVPRRLLYILLSLYIVPLAAPTVALVSAFNPATLYSSLSLTVFNFPLKSVFSLSTSLRIQNPSSLLKMYFCLYLPVNTSLKPLCNYEFLKATFIIFFKPTRVWSFWKPMKIVTFF